MTLSLKTLLLFVIAFMCHSAATAQTKLSEEPHPQDEAFLKAYLSYIQWQSNTEYGVNHLAQKELMACFFEMDALPSKALNPLKPARRLGGFAHIQHISSTLKRIALDRNTLTDAQYEQAYGILAAELKAKFPSLETVSIWPSIPYPNDGVVQLAPAQLMLHFKYSKSDASLISQHFLEFQQQKLPEGQRLYATLQSTRPQGGSAELIPQPPEKSFDLSKVVESINTQNRCD